MRFCPMLSDLAGGFARVFRSFPDTPGIRRDYTNETPAALSLNPVWMEWVQTGRLALSGSVRGRTFLFCSEMCKFTFDCDPGES